MRQVLTLAVDAGEDGVRLDRWFRRRWPYLSQGQVQKLLRSGQVRVDAVGLRGGIDGRDQVRNAGVQLGTTFGTYRIVPANVQIREITADQAKVSLTARFEGSAPADIDAQEFAITFRKQGGKWRIGMVETVRLLRR